MLPGQRVVSCRSIAKGLRVLIVAACVFFAVGNNTAGIAFLGGDVVLVGIALAGGVIDLPRKGSDEDEGEPES